MVQRVLLQCRTTKDFKILHVVYKADLSFSNINLHQPATKQTSSCQTGANPRRTNQDSIPPTQGQLIGSPLKPWIVWPWKTKYWFGIQNPAKPIIKVGRTTCAIDSFLQNPSGSRPDWLTRHGTWYHGIYLSAKFRISDSKEWIEEIIPAGMDHEHLVS